MRATMVAMVTLSDLGLMLGGSLAPLGCCVAFIARPCDEVLAEIETVRAGRELECIGPVGFEMAASHLDPMEAPWTTEVVVDCGAWTAYLNNFINGGDPSAIAPAVARRLDATCVTAVNVPRYGPGHASTQFLLQGPAGRPPLMAIRTLAAHCQDGRWSWHESGIVQPFEQPQRYGARVKRDRLDRPLLVEYLGALGIDVDDSAFYGPAWVVRQVVGWETRRVSVEAFRRESGWSTGHP